MIIFIMNQQMWVTDENNRGIFQELQNIIMGKIRSIILGSGLITTLIYNRPELNEKMA